MLDEAMGCRLHESGWLERTDWEVEQSAIRAAYRARGLALRYNAMVLYANGGSITQALETENKAEAQGAADCLAEKYREQYGEPYMAAAELVDIRRLAADVPN